jgi:DNA-binding CsgD family transcriptional regulator
MTGVDAQSFQSAIEAIYDAALDPALWSRAADKLKPAMGGGCHLLVFDTEQAQPLFSIANCFDSAFFDRYYGHYMGISPYFAPFAKASTGIPLWADDLVTRQCLLRTEFYHDFMRPAGISPSFAGLKLCAMDKTHLSLAINIVRPESVSNCAATERLLSEIGRHVLRAFEINKLMVVSHDNRSTLDRLLGHLQTAVLVIDQHRRVLSANRLAEDLLTRQRLLQTAAGGELHACRSDDDERLGRYLSSTNAPAAHPVSLHCTTTGRRYTAWRLRLHSGRKHLARRYDDIAAAFPRATDIVLVSPMDNQLTVEPDLIRTVFNLTIAESRLVSALVAGRTLAEHARELGVSVKTARNQLASAFGKTDTTTQSELVRLVLSALSILVATRSA